MLTINTKAVFLFEPLDRKNGYQTLGINWDNDEVIKIGSDGYSVVKFVLYNPQYSYTQVINFFQNSIWSNPSFDINSFLDFMIKNKIITDKS